MPDKKPTLLQEFQTFISKGNVIDLAVGIIIGSAFTGIVNSLVKEVILPPIGLVLGKVNFTDLKIVLQAASTDTLGKAIPEVAIMYGSLLQNIFNFLIVAMVVFSLVKAINALKKKEEKKEEVKTKETETELAVLKDIRSALQSKKSK